MGVEHPFDLTTGPRLDVLGADGSFRDGSETRGLEVLENARVRSSSSDELAVEIRDWPTRFHLARHRANLLRPFRIGEGLRGARGCRRHRRAHQCEAAISPLAHDIDWSVCDSTLEAGLDAASTGGELIVSDKDRAGLNRQSVSATAQQMLRAIESGVTGVLHIGGPRRTVLEYAQSLDASREIGALSVKDVTFSVPVDTSLDTSRYRREVRD